MKGVHEIPCPICGDGVLTAHREQVTVSYKGQEGKIQSHYSLCGTCGVDQVGEQEAKLNKRAMIAFRKQVDGLLSGEQVKGIREHFGLRQVEAAKIFGGGPVAFSKYENDDVAQSEPMDRLLRLTNALPAAFKWLAERAGYPRYLAEHANYSVLRKMPKVQEVPIWGILPMETFRPEVRERRGEYHAVALVEEGFHEWTVPALGAHVALHSEKAVTSAMSKSFCYKGTIENNDFLKAAEA